MLSVISAPVGSLVLDSINPRRIFLGRDRFRAPIRAPIVLLQHLRQYMPRPTAPASSGFRLPLPPLPAFYSTQTLLALPPNKIVCSPRKSRIHFECERQSPLAMLCNSLYPSRMAADPHRQIYWRLFLLTSAPPSRGSRSLLARLGYHSIIPTTASSCS